jgi:hypothetical protein
MLTIRKAQWEALVDDRCRGLCAWLAPHLREHFSRTLARTSDAALQSLITDSVARARELGASSSEAVCRFVHLRVVFGSGLESRPWAVQVLGSPVLSGDAKIGLLHRRARDLLVARRATVAEPRMVGAQVVEPPVAEPQVAEAQVAEPQAAEPQMAEAQGTV